MSFRDICGNYRNRPQVCKNFPSLAHEILEHPDCSYWFDAQGNRKGKCNGCGGCCVKPWLYLPEFGYKYREEPCPYYTGT